MSEPHSNEAIVEDQDIGPVEDLDNEEDYDDGDEEFFDDEDAEAEAVAKQLGDALWADISKAYAQQGPQQPAETPSSLANHPSLRPPSPSLSEEGDDQETLTNAIRIVLDLSTSHPRLHHVLSTTLVSRAQNNTLLEVLTRLAGLKTTLTPELAESLSHLVQSVADGEICEVSKKTNELRHGAQETATSGQVLGIISIPDTL